MHMCERQMHVDQGAVVLLAAHRPGCRYRLLCCAMLWDGARALTRGLSKHISRHQMKLLGASCGPTSAHPRTTIRRHRSSRTPALPCPALSWQCRKVNIQSQHAAGQCSAAVRGRPPPVPSHFCAAAAATSDAGSAALLLILLLALLLLLLLLLLLQSGGLRLSAAAREASGLVSPPAWPATATAWCWGTTVMRGQLPRRSAACGSGTAWRWRWWAATPRCPPPGTPCLTACSRPLTAASPPLCTTPGCERLPALAAACCRWRAELLHGAGPSSHAGCVIYSRGCPTEHTPPVSACLQLHRHHLCL